MNIRKGDFLVLIWIQVSYLIGLRLNSQNIESYMTNGKLKWIALYIEFNFYCSSMLYIGECGQLQPMRADIANRTEIIIQKFYDTSINHHRSGNKKKRLEEKHPLPVITDSCLNQLDFQPSAANDFDFQLFDTLQQDASSVKTN